MEPYQSGVIPPHWKNPIARDILGRIVAISGLRVQNRQEKLIYPMTRSLVKNSIVELEATNEQDVGSGGMPSDVLYIGFFEISVGGEAVVGESVSIGGKNIGNVAGFSEIHYPNHLKICLKSEDWFAKKTSTKSLQSWGEFKSVYDLDLKLEELVVISPRKCGEPSARAIGHV